MTFPQDLVFADICLYGGASAFDDVENVVSGDNTSHIEIYIGNGQSVASRNGIGVGKYPFRPDGLVRVRRVVGIPDQDAGMTWFTKVDGSPYGFDNLLETLEPTKADVIITLPLIKTPMDCSCFASCFLEACAAPQFNQVFDRRRTRPRDFEIVRENNVVWSA